MSFIPLVGDLLKGGLGIAGQAAQAAPSTAYRQSSDYNPVVNINQVNSAGDLKSVGDLISSLNAGNSYNGGFADFGLNSAPLGGGISVSSGLLGNNSKISIGPVILIGGILALLVYLKKRKK